MQDGIQLWEFLGAKGEAVLTERLQLMKEADEALQELSQETHLDYTELIQCSEAQPHLRQIEHGFEVIIVTALQYARPALVAGLEDYKLNLAPPTLPYLGSWVEYLGCGEADCLENPIVREIASLLHEVFSVTPQVQVVSTVTTSQ